jgi:hypothetical protein
MKTELERRETSPSAVASVAIETLEDYDLAKRRIELLRNGECPAQREGELAALCDAVRAWDKTHDYVTRW